MIKGLFTYNPAHLISSSNLAFLVESLSIVLLRGASN